MRQDDHSQSAGPVLWRQSRFSSSGAVAACVQATPAILRPDGSVVVTAPGRPTVVLMHLSTEAEPAKAEPWLTELTEVPAPPELSTWTVSSLDLDLDQVKGLPGFSGHAPSYRETLAQDLAGLSVGEDQISSILAEYDRRAATGDTGALNGFDQQVADAMRRIARLRQDQARPVIEDVAPRAPLNLGEHAPRLDRALVLAPEQLAARLRDLHVPEREIPGLLHDYDATVRSGDQGAWDAFTDRLEGYELAADVRSSPLYVRSFVSDLRDAGVPASLILARVREYESLRPGDAEGLASFDRDVAADLRRYSPDTSQTDRGIRRNGPTLTAELHNSLVLQPERLVGQLRALGVDEAELGGFVRDYAAAVHGNDPAAIAHFATRLDDYLRTRPGLAQPLRIGSEDQEPLPDYISGLISDLRSLDLPEDAIALRVAQYQRLARRGDPDELSAFDQNMAALLRNLENERARGSETPADVTDVGDVDDADETDLDGLPDFLTKRPARPAPIRRPATDRPGGVNATRLPPRPRRSDSSEPHEENHTLVMEREPEAESGFGGGLGFLSEFSAEDEGFPLEQAQVETSVETEAETLTRLLTVEPETADEIVEALIHELERQRPRPDEEVEQPLPAPEISVLPEQEQETPAQEAPELEQPLPTTPEEAWQRLIDDLRATRPGSAPTRATMPLAEYIDLLDQRARSALADATEHYAENPVNAAIGFDLYAAHQVAQAIDGARDEALTALGIDPGQVPMDALQPLSSLRTPTHVETDADEDAAGDFDSDSDSEAEVDAVAAAAKSKSKGKGKATEDESAQGQAPPALPLTFEERQDEIEQALQDHAAAEERVLETDRQLLGLRDWETAESQSSRDPRPELEQRREDELFDLLTAEGRLRSLSERPPGNPPQDLWRPRPAPKPRTRKTTRQQRRQQVRRNRYGINRDPLASVPEDTQLQLPPLSEKAPPEKQDEGEQTPAVPPPGPWYTQVGALGEYTVSGLHLPDDPAAAGLTVSRGIQAPPGVGSGLARQIAAHVGGAVHQMLTPRTDDTDAARREAWQREHLRTGRFLTVDGHSVWVRPVVDTLTHIPKPPPGPEGPGPREYQVNFGGPARESGIETEESKGLDGLFETALNVAGSHLSSIIPAAPTVGVDSKRTKSATASTQNISGRKLMSAGATEFGAGLKFRVYVDGREWTSDGALADVLDIKFPEAFSGAMDNSPDVTTRVPHIALPNYRSPHARVMISAVDPAPFVAELQRELLAAEVPAASVNSMIKKLMEEMLSETSIRNRERWWISSGDVSSKIHQGTGTFTAFEGDFTATVKITRLENITDDDPTAQVRLRDDIGLAFAKARGRGRSSSAALNVMTDFGGMHALEGSREDLGYLMGGVSATSERAHSSMLGSASMNKTTLMRDTVQERYRAEVEVTITTSSSTHAVRPAVARTIAEIDVPQSEAAEFEHTVLGRVETPRLAREHTPLSVQNQPNVRNVLRGAAELGVLPALGRRRPGRLIDPSNWEPDPTEPLALRSRTGQSFGMLLSLPGSERVYHAVDSILRAKVAAAQGRARRTARAAGLARGVDWSQAHRDLSSHFGTPALEGDLQVLLAGIDHSLKIDGVKYDVSVVGFMGRRVRQETYDLTVNARATGGDTVTSARNRIKALSLFLAGSARFKIKDFVKFEAGNFGIEGSYGWNRSTALTAGAKTYRRTETVGQVTDNTYEMVYELKIRTGGPGGRVETWYIHGEDVVGRFAVPKQHVPKQQVPTAPTTRTPASASALIPAARVGAPRPASAPLDFDTARTDGLYPVFSNIPELARTAGRLYQALNGITRTDQRWDWPEPLRSMATPTSLQNGFDASVGKRGWTVRLPDHGGWKQAVKYELALYATEHEKEHFDEKSLPATDGGAETRIQGDGEVEIEWYQQAVGHLSQGQGSDKEIAATLGLGPVFTPGKEDEQAGGGENGTSRKASNQVAVNVSGGGSYKTSKLTTNKNGSIDITRTTYGGSVHAYRSNPYFKITVMRWKDGVKGRREESRSETVYAPQALEFIIPEQRARDLNLPLPATATAPPHPQPGEPVLAMDDPELALSMSHPELLDADDVLDVLVERLRRHGLMKEPTTQIPGGRPNDLMEYLEKRFGSRALQNEFVNLRRTGVVGWYPIPKSLGAGAHLWIRVTGTPTGVTSSRARGDVKLTIRSENFAETEQEHSVEHGTSALFHAVGHTSVGESRFGGGLQAGYTASSERSERETTAMRDIFRIGTSDKSVEFNLDMRYKIEIGVSTEPPELARLSMQAAKKAMFGAADLLAKNDYGGRSMREFWYRNRPWHWFETITDRPRPHTDGTDAGATDEAPLRTELSGSVRLLTPAHQTAPAPQHKPLVAPSEGENVAWIPKRPANAVPSPRLPRGAFDRLRDKIHPNTVPAAHAMGKWAGLTTVPEYRREPDLAKHQADSVPELGLDTLPGLQLSYLTSDSVTRADIVNLLDHRHKVPVRGEDVNIGVDIVSARRINSTTFKARRYAQQETEPGGEQKESSGWGYALQFIGGRADESDTRIFESEPAYKAGHQTTALSGAHAGEIEENDQEERVGYRYYAMDVDVVIDGPNGTLTMRVPNGLYAMLPERDGVFLEQRAPGVFGEATRTDPTEDTAAHDDLAEAIATPLPPETEDELRLPPAPIDLLPPAPTDLLQPAPIDYEGPWRRSSVCATVNGSRACVDVAVITLAR